jgi:hypothetical protein
VSNLKHFNKSRVYVKYLEGTDAACGTFLWWSAKRRKAWCDDHMTASIDVEHWRSCDVASARNFISNLRRVTCLRCVVAAAGSDVP